MNHINFIQLIEGGRMRNYSYINGTRFAVVNLFRSLRFDIDRLDLSWVDDTKPDFVRGLRVVDSEESNTVTVHAADADNLMYSLSYIYSREETADAFRAAIDAYLTVALETKDYLVSTQKKDPAGKPETVEAIIH
jgi:hypothetical protein